MMNYYFLNLNLLALLLSLLVCAFSAFFHITVTRIVFLCFLPSTYLAVTTFDRHPGLADHVHIRIGGCFHVAHDSIRNIDVYNLSWYTNCLQNNLPSNDLSTYRVAYLEANVYGTRTVDREYLDDMVDDSKRCDGPPVTGKSYNRRVLIRSDFLTTIFQLSPNPPSYLSNAPINNMLFYLFDSQRFSSSDAAFYPEFEICVQVHVDHRKRARFPLINNGWMFDADSNGPPSSSMKERPPMTATKSHPTKPDYPVTRMFLSSFYIQQCHPANQVTRFLYQYFGVLSQRRSSSNHNPPPNASVNDASSPGLSQYKSTSENRSTSRASSAPSYVYVSATSILWYNSID